MLLVVPYGMPSLLLCVLKYIRAIADFSFSKIAHRPSPLCVRALPSGDLWIVTIENMTGVNYSITEVTANRCSGYHIGLRFLLRRHGK